MAQGAAMALEDAACLAQAVSSAQSLKHAFAETAKRRMHRTLRLHNETVRTGKIYHAHGLLNHVRNVSLNFSPDSLLHLKLRWLYKTA
jgi:2-polyprenyl-6-methoxyphenol hydroxylase-like FAD-dependent oxidoreductase